MQLFSSEFITDSFEQILETLYYEPEFIASPRGQEVKEIRNCCIEVSNPMYNIYTNKHRNSPLKYISAEILWYFSGTNNPTFIENYASMWKSLHNPNGTVNSAYGNLLFTEKNEYGYTQYEWVIESLKRDKDTRQAFMHFNKPRHQFFENKDQVCTLNALFHIRKNVLYMTLTMRSNDVIFGFMTDWAFFSILFYHVYLHLKNYYPELKLGSYTHISHSMHLYERHYDLVKEMVKNPYKDREPFNKDFIPYMNEPILDEMGNIRQKYKEALEPIQKGEFKYTQTGNDLLDWCFNKLKE